MHALLIVVAMAVLAGCATAPQTRYWSTYRVEGTDGELDGRSAEQLQLVAANSTMASASAGHYDAPVRLVRAPQQVMSREDTDDKVVGRVVVEILFGESGAVELLTVVESTKDSLADSVRTAAQQWRVAPVTRAGKPSKVRVRQEFSFKTDW